MAKKEISGLTATIQSFPEKSNIPIDLGSRSVPFPWTFVRSPSASRSLIAFTARSSFAHAAVMGAQAFRNMISRGELVGVVILVVIGVALIALAPAKQPAERVGDRKMMASSRVERYPL